MEHVRVGVGVMVKQGNSVLLGHRKARKEKYDTWTFPGGAPDVGERLVDTARRELKEETGLEGISFECIGIVDDFNGAAHDHWVTVNFMCEEFEGEVIVGEPEKFEEWKWFPLNALPDNIFPPSQKTIDCFNSTSFYLFEKEGN